MKEHEFTAILPGISEITDEAASALYEAGFDDGSPGSCHGVVSVDFHRERESAGVWTSPRDAGRIGGRLLTLDGLRSGV